MQHYGWTAVLSLTCGFLGSALHGGLLGPAPAQAQPERPVKVLSAQKFQLVDLDGTPRAEWFVKPSGLPVITLYDRERSPRLRMGITDAGDPEVVLSGKGQSSSVSVGVDRAVPYLRLAGKNKKNRVKIFVDKGEEPVLLLADENEKDRLMLTVPQGGPPSLVVLDEKQNFLWTAP
jgi:hypothetical protein